MTARVATARIAAPSPRRAAPTRPALRPVATTKRAAKPVSRISRLTARLPWHVNPVGVAVGMIVAALLAVVVGNTMLASGQLQLERAQSALTAVQSQYAAQLALVTTQESPAAVAHDAVSTGLAPPSEILQLPSTPLGKRLGAPVFSSAPCCTLTPGR